MSKVKPQEALQIDLDRLEVEWQAQPKLYYDFAAELAAARRDMRTAENRLPVIKAEAAKLIRTEPDRFGLTKLTEAIVSENVVLQEAVQEAQSELNDEKYRVDMLAGMVTAMDHRKKTLEKEVDLWLANYFASPRASSEVSREKIDELEKRSARRKGTRKREE